MENNDKITITSRKKWFWLGVIITLLNPIFSGLILGVVFWNEPELKKEGKIILSMAIIWGIAMLFLSSWLANKGYLNV